MQIEVIRQINLTRHVYRFEFATEFRTAAPAVLWLDEYFYQERETARHKWETFRFWSFLSRMDYRQERMEYKHVPLSESEDERVAKLDSAFREAKEILKARIDEIKLMEPVNEILSRRIP